MVIVEAGQDPLAAKVDQFRLRACMFHHIRIIADGEKFSVLDRDRRCSRIGAIKRGDEPVIQDEISIHRSVSF